MFLTQDLVAGAGFAVIGLILGFAARQIMGASKAGSFEKKAKESFEEAKIKSQDIILEAKEKADSLLQEVKNEEKARKQQMDKLEERLLKKEDQVEKQNQELAHQQVKVNQDVEKLRLAKQQIDVLKEKAEEKIEEIAGLSREEAKKKVIEEAKEEGKQEIIRSIQQIEREKKEEVEKKSLEIITSVIQRYARSHVSELTTSVFVLPDEDLKGKIIGREGRNIRAIERETGVELIVDETPDSIIISSFDPLRREIAKLALEKLLKDGRIQPAKIEEKVEEAKQEINKRIIELGEQATLEVGVYDLPKEIIQILGRLHFRTSYGQNVLTHSIEMAHISRMMAAELGLNVEVAKKAALLHDIGKAIDHEVEGTHVEIGRKILKKYNIDEHVIQAMESHHDEYPYSVPESFVVAAADALSAARPGARRDTVENYIKRLQDLEKIASNFPGVKSSYAVSAGRELRIFVIPEKVDDFGALQMARDIAKQIESELKYPGEIKVNVIREMRAVEYAK